ncbi:MAG: chromate transporter [Bacteroidales bacterium]|nr:chromate transporter [Bacteroidales bacterium]
MIYWQLFWAYLKIGILGFGGGYAMLSMIQFEVVDHYNWMTMEEFADIVALSQMTPGPVSINLATFIGYTVGGIWGSLLATAAIVLPSLLMLVLVLKFLFKNKENYIVKTTLASMKPVIAGLIFVAALLMMNPTSFVDFGLHQNNFSVIICAVSFVAVFWAKINPILIILASGLVGYLIY